MVCHLISWSLPISGEALGSEVDENGGAGDDGSDDDEDGLEEDSESELEEEDPVIHVEDW